MKHGTSCPQLCSQCRGAVPRVVTVEGPLVLIAGAPTGRGVDPDNGTDNYYSRRGGNAHGRRKQE